MESAETFQNDRIASAQKSAALGPARLPISGLDIQSQARIFAAHAERCIEARLRSYQLAYTETAQTPSEKDFGEILNDCKAVSDNEAERCTKQLKQFAGSSSPVGAPLIEDMVRRGSGVGFDRVLRKFKIWKAKTQLIPSSVKTAERTKQRDVLVPTFNRAEFELDLPELISQSGEKRPCSLLFLDLDKFKAINDGPGLHEAGDRALKECAGVLLQTCEGRGTVYRYGGDEFCVLLPNHTLDEATAVAERIVRGVRADKTEERPHGLSTSIGAACFPESTDDPSKLLSQADRAQRASKDAGGNQVSKADLAKGKVHEVGTAKFESNAQLAAPDKRIPEFGVDPYIQELKRIAKQVVYDEMTLEGRHVLRHLMIHEPVEVGQTLLREIPQDRTYAQLAIARERGLVKPIEERQGLLRTYWAINPQFRDVLQEVLYEGGTN
jgi:diguanylate cyclase (GGDEF)-like protein